MRSVGWAPIQYDWFPHKKTKSGHRNVRGKIMGGNREKTDTSHLQAKVKALGRNHAF